MCLGLLSPRSSLEPESGDFAAPPPRKKELWAQEAIKNLSSSTQSLPIFDCQRARKWHVTVDALARDRKPSEKKFPFSKLHEATQAYLRHHRNATTADHSLEKLIKSHSSKLLAFAACVSHLSPAAALQCFNRFFVSNYNGPTIDRNSMETLEAFVAASKSEADTFSTNDGEVARALICAENSTITPFLWPVHIKILLSTLTVSRPVNSYILYKSSSVVEEFCKDMNRTFDVFQPGTGQLKHPVFHGFDSQILERAIAYAEALSLVIGGDSFIQELIGTHIPQWRAWAKWKPALERLKTWTKIRTRYSPLEQLLYLEGPDLQADGPLCWSKGQGVGERGELAAWLASKGFRTGIGGSEHMSTRPDIGRLLWCAVQALSKQDNSARLLCFYIDRSDLDEDALNSYCSVPKLLTHSFIRYLTAPSCDEEDISDDVLLKGIGTVSELPMLYVQRLFLPEVGKLIRRFAESLFKSFENELKDHGQWFPHAQRLWRLRSTVTHEVWLHDEAVRCWLLQYHHEQALVIDLTSLKELYDKIQQHDNETIAELRPAVVASIRAFVAIGIFETYETKAITSKQPHCGDWSRDRLIESLYRVGLYKCKGSYEVQTVAIWIASLRSLETGCRIECIDALLTLEPSVWNDLRDCVVKLRDVGRSACVQFTHAVTLIMETGVHRNCWLNLLRWALIEYKVDVSQSDFASSELVKYGRWIVELKTLGLRDEVGLSSSACTWLSIVAQYEQTLDGLQRWEGAKKVIPKILTAWPDKYSRAFYWLVMNRLHEKRHSYQLELMQHIFISCVDDDTQRKLLLNTIDAVGDLSPKAVALCEYILDLFGTKNTNNVSARLNFHLQSRDLDEPTESTLLQIGRLMHLHPSYIAVPAYATLSNVRKDHKEHIAALLAQAKQLERSCLTINRQDPLGVEKMTTDLGLEKVQNVSIGALLMANLSGDLLNVIDETSDDNIVFHFPLAHLNAMAKTAYGLKAENLLVYLQPTECGGIGTICVHLEESSDIINYHGHHGERSSYVSIDVSGLADMERSHGRSLRLMYLVAQTLRVLLRGHRDAELSLEALYNSVKEYIETAASGCMSCQAPLGVRLHRPTLCNSSFCRSRFKAWDLGLQLEDIRNHEKTVDLLLTAVFATASKGTHLDLLLPNLPTGQSKAEDILNCLRALPALSLAPLSLQKSISSRRDATQLLSWVCNSYRGFLFPATDAYKIPNMPGIYQFLLVNGAPEIEEAFSKHNHRQPRHVLFHGTSIDRLYPVLAQGLKILSGTALQKHGQVHGPGIYMAREPSTALSYANSSNSQSVTTSTLKFFDTASRLEFLNARVLLGCEHAGNDEGGGKAGGVHVITDASRVAVRYVWIVPANARVPRAQDIRIPMLGVISGLRASAAKKTATPLMRDLSKEPTVSRDFACSKAAASADLNARLLQLRSMLAR